jgi:hypothetical protein
MMSLSGNRHLPSFLDDILAAYKRQRKPKDLNINHNRTEDDYAILRETQLNRLINQQKVLEEQTQQGVKANTANLSCNPVALGLLNSLDLTALARSDSKQNFATKIHTNYNDKSQDNSSSTAQSTKKEQEETPVTNNSRRKLTAAERNKLTIHPNDNSNSNSHSSNNNNSNTNNININTTAKYLNIAPSQAAKPNPRQSVKAEQKSPARKPDKDNSDKPICPYGTGCYRKNPQHFIDMQHSASPRAAATSQKPSLSKRSAAGSRRRKTVNYKEDDEEEDEEAENSEDREFIAADDEVEFESEDDDWGLSSTKKNKNQKKSSGKAKKRRRSSEDDSEEDYVPTKEELREVNLEEDADAHNSQLSDEESPDSDEEMQRSADDSAQKNSSGRKPMCEYGAQCYRRNPQHLKDFRHPGTNINSQNKKQKTEKEEENSSIDAAAAWQEAPINYQAKAKTNNVNNSSSSADLPNFFHGLEAYVHSSVEQENHSLINRFFISFDGDLTDAVTPSTTHIIADKRLSEDHELNSLYQQYNAQIKFVRSAWAVDCIKKKQLLEESSYELEQ